MLVTVTVTGGGQVLVDVEKMLELGLLDVEGDWDELEDMLVDVIVPS